MALTTLASVAAAAAYLDGKYHVGADLKAIYENARVVKRLERSVAADRTSLWYQFEEQVQRIPAGAECIWSREATYTWRETYNQACRYAQMLQSHGIKPRELVAIYLQNSPELMFATLACWALGSAPAFVNYNLTGDALVHCLKVNGAKIVLVDPDHDCRSRIDQVKHRIGSELGMEIIVLDDNLRAGIASLLPERPPDELRSGISVETPMALFYTSGTTGLPKACKFTLSRTVHIGEFRNRLLGLKCGPDGDRWYDCMPLYHGTGCCLATGCMLTGNTLCIGKKFSTSRFWDDIRDSRATAFVYVGETIRYLLAAPATPRDRDHNVKAIHGNGLRPDVWTKFRDRFGIQAVYEFFNSSEGVFGMQNVCFGDYHVGSVGHHGAIARFAYRNTFVPVRIDHDTGDIWRDPKTGLAQRASYEEGGEILVAVPDESAFGGYYKNPEATAKKFARNILKQGDLFYRSGDALRRNQDGQWFFLDRLGDTFRWKGENCSTAEIAEVMGNYPGIEEANVYGVELPSHDGRAGCAAVYIAPPAFSSFNFGQLLAHCRARLPRYAVPIFLRLVQELAPTMHNNKQSKVQLRNEGVDPDKIANGTGGREDVLYWVPPGGDSYVPYGRQDWESLLSGKARL